MPQIFDLFNKIVTTNISNHTIQMPVDTKCNVEYDVITHRTYGNPYNKAAFPISTFERTQLVNLFECFINVTTHKLMNLFFNSWKMMSLKMK